MPDRPVIVARVKPAAGAREAGLRGSRTARGEPASVGGTFERAPWAAEPAAIAAHRASGARKARGADPARGDFGYRAWTVVRARC